VNILRATTLLKIAARIQTEERKLIFSANEQNFDTGKKKLSLLEKNLLQVSK